MNSSISSFKRQAISVVRDLLPFFLFFLLLDRLVFLGIRRAESSFYRNISSYSLADKFAQVKGKGPFGVLILGTSRTYDGIHPGYIQDELGVKAFKEAFVGKGPMYNYLFYEQYKKTLGIPRVVIYGLDYFLFNITSERHWLKRFPASLVDGNYFKSGISLLLVNKSRIDEFGNTFINSMKNNPWADVNYLNEMDLARMDAYRGVVSPGKIDSVEPPRFRKVMFFGPPGKEGDYFFRLLDELRRDKVTVLLVAMPEFIGTYRTNSNHRKFLRNFRKLGHAYDNVHFYNYDDPKSFDLANPDYFIDGGYGKTNSHLSRAGAEIFNRMLVRDLRRYFTQK